MKRNSFLLCSLITLSFNILAQVGISIDSSAPDNSAMLDVKSNSKGFLLPRMTRVQRDVIDGPVNGLMVFCTDCGTG
jgi:hypothetical protein